MSVISLDEARTRAKTHDPDTSHTAAQSLNEEHVSVTKQAILTILEDGPQTVNQIAGIYFAHRAEKGWPNCHPHSIARRLSELHRQDHKVIDTGYRTQGPYGRPIALWALTNWNLNENIPA